MIISRPKFCVGELVAIVSELRPDLNCASTEIIETNYFEGTVSLDVPFKGWVYRVTDNAHAWCEPALRKLPSDPERSFKTLMDRLKEEETMGCVT